MWLIEVAAAVASTDEKIKSIIIIHLILQLTDYADEKIKSIILKQSVI